MPSTFSSLCITCCLAAHRSQDIRVPQAINFEGASSAGSSAAEAASVLKRQTYSKPKSPALLTSNIKEAAFHSSCPALLPCIRRPKACSECDAILAKKDR